ncbi:MAG: hypothetical protein DWQ08_05135, partial [Proteobacteria bacterium]
VEYDLLMVAPITGDDERATPKSWYGVKSDLEKTLRQATTEGSMKALWESEDYMGYHVSDLFQDKYIANKAKWQSVLDRVAAIAEASRMGSINNP